MKELSAESLHYETLKHDGRLPIVGVNTFLSERDAAAEHAGAALVCSTEQEKQDQVTAVRAFQAQHAARSGAARAALRIVAASGGNLFAALLEFVKTCSLGQITRSLYEVGGQYRRSV